ncbi:unnamed protein product, partial [Ixodes pacificus]
MSCAGQMETFLNVAGLQEVIRCAVKCWASQFRHPALEYKWQHGQPLEAPMAVLVQEMVQSDVAGVLFTCDPVSGDPTRFVINANYGLGESVVSSLAEPDTVTLERSEDGQMTISYKHPGKKQLQVCATGDTQGTEVQKVDNADECCISEQQALLLGRAAQEVGRLHPGTSDLDLEWAIAEGKLYLLQARPITSLHRETDFEIEHELDSALLSEDEFYTRANVAEVLPGATSALGEELFLHSFTLMFKSRFLKFLSPPTPETIFIRPFFVMVSRNCLMSLLDGMFQHKEKQSLMTKGIFYGVLGRLYESKDVVAKFVERNGHPSKLSGFQQMAFLLKAQWWKEHYLQLAKDAIKNMRIDLTEEQTALEMFDVVSKSLPLPPEPHFNLMTTSMLSSMSNLMLLVTLGSVSGDLTPEVFSDLATLLSNCEQVESADVPARLKVNCPYEGRYKVFLLALEAQGARSLLRKQGRVQNDLYRPRPTILREKHLFMQFDMLSVPWQLDPEPLITTLQHAVASPEPASVESTEPILSTPLNLWRRVALRLLVPWTKQAVAGRETAKALSVRCVHIFRLALIKLGRKMVQEGRLPDPRLVFHLELDELRRLLDTRSAALVLKAIRRNRIHPALGQLRFPDIVRGVPCPVGGPGTELQGPREPACVKGTPVSRGSVTAPARVVKTLDAADCIQ